MARDAAVSRERPFLPTLAGHTNGAEVALATEGDNVDWGFGLGQTETGASQPRSFLRNSLLARKGSA